MTKQVRPAIEKSITMVALEAGSMIGFHSRGFHHGPEPLTAPPKEAADMLAVRPCYVFTSDPEASAPNATSLRPPQGQAAFGGALRAALSAQPGLGPPVLRDAALIRYATKGEPSSRAPHIQRRD